MRYLITGGAGFVGANLVHRCVSEPGSQITVLDSLDPQFQSMIESLSTIRDKFRFIQADIRDEAVLADVVRDQDAVIHCAGQTSHPLSMREPILDAEINCLGSLNLLEALRRHNPQATVVFASTITVIGRPTADVIDENHHERPLDFYSANNGLAEKYFQLYHRTHGLKTVCLRLPNLYGPFGKGDPQFGFVNYFISRALADEELPVFGDGQQRRNVMHVDDAVDILLLAARDPRLVGQALFATSDEYLSVSDIARRIVAEFGRGRVKQVDWPTERQSIECGSLSISSARLRSLTGWSPSYDFAVGLRRTRQILEQALRERKL